MASVDKSIFAPADTGKTDYSKESRVKPVVQGKVSVRKDKPIGRKFKEVFLAEDWDTVKQYIIWDVVIPGIKYTFVNALEMMILGKRGVRGESTYVNYSSFGSSNRNSFKTNSPSVSSNNKRKPDVRDVVFEPDFDKYPNEMEARERALDDAHKVLRELQDAIETFGVATVSDFYRAAEMSTEYTEGDWGWRDLSGVGVYECRQGFYINLPKPRYLK